MMACSPPYWKHHLQSPYLGLCSLRSLLSRPNLIHQINRCSIMFFFRGCEGSFGCGAVANHPCQDEAGIRPRGPNVSPSAPRPHKLLYAAASSSAHDGSITRGTTPSPEQSPTAQTPTSSRADAFPRGCEGLSDARPNSP